MKDSECIRFLQGALPRLRLWWPGFRKVRAQVCKRIDRRWKELELSGIDAYRTYIEAHPEEWNALDGLCHITISRFYRDRAVFRLLEREILVRTAEGVSAGGKQEIRCWCAGCASGEEAYTLAILWEIDLRPLFPDLNFSITATDIENIVLERAKLGCYWKSGLKEMPEDLLTRAFFFSDQGYCVKEKYRQGIDFLRQDIRQTFPEGLFHLILCRNLVFTYFDQDLQREILQKILDKLYPGGVLVIGIHESLPEGVTGFSPLFPTLGIYQKI